MSHISLNQGRRITGVCLLLSVVLGVYSFFSPGIPVLWGPTASAHVKESGRKLFEHEWLPNDPLAGGDGLGPVFNARSCVACHSQGGVGGGGPNQHNVLAFEVLPTIRDPEVHSGLVHHFAVDASARETPGLVRKLFPVIPGGVRTVDHCEVRVQDFDRLRMETINSTALFGAGWIDRISSSAITSNRLRRLVTNSIKEFQLDFDTIGSGRPRVLPNGRIGKFGWKAQFATLKEFVAAACANELGLGNPLMEQASPLAVSHASPRKRDLDREQFSHLVAFVDTLPCPVEVEPESASASEKAVRGKEVFHAVGCAVCHIPDIGGVKGVYSDFLLHDVDRPSIGGGGSYRQQTPEVPLPEDHPKPAEWKTPPLWGVSDSAPYFHDGGSATLQAAILRHGNEADSVTQAYQKLHAEDREALLAFLRTLRAPR